MADPILFARVTTTSLDSSPESATTALYRAAIGTVNNDYYLPIFTRFEAANRTSPGWNWAASLCTLNWMVFRQLWLATLVYVATMVGSVSLLFVFGSLLFQFPKSVLLSNLAALGVLSFVIPGIYGYAMLHAASRRKMALALSISSTIKDACFLLNRQAASKKRFVWLAMANLVLAGATAGTYVAFLDSKTPTFHAQKMSGVSNPDVSHITDIAALTASALFSQNQETKLVPVVCETCPGNVAVTTSRATQGALQADPSKALSESFSQAAEIEPASETALFVPRRPVLVASVPLPPAAQHYYINVGLFAKINNAHNANTKLLEAGLNAFTQNLKTPQGSRTRVRVGPFETQAEANAAAKKIVALKLEAVVFQQ